MSVLLLAGALLLGATCAETNAAAASGQPLRVGLFVDRGCSGGGVLRWAEMLDGSPDVDLHILRGKEIAAGGLTGLDLLVMPGGRGDWQYQSLGDAGAQAIRDYVAGGGKYYGTCCGIAVALNEDTAGFRRLRMIPFKRIIAPNRGGVRATVAFNDKAKAYLGVGGRRMIYYHNGPALQPADPVPLCTEVEVLATMDCELAQEGPVKGAMYGTPAAVRAKYGKGEMLAFNCHPEINADSRDIVYAGIRALTGRMIAQPPKRTPTGKKRVGFKSAGIGAKKRGVEKYLELVHDPKVYVVPVTDDQLKTGYGEVLDEVVAPEAL